MKGYQYCNNCGLNTHSLYQCKLPILSTGIIAVDYKSKPIKYLMICRKDSLGYVDFIRGKYSTLDLDYLQNIIDEMTMDEKYNILNKNFDDLWYNLWSSCTGLQHRGEQKISKDKFELLKSGIIVKEKMITLKDIIDKSTTSWDTPEWGFPKGKRNYRESEYDCALREFQEETGITSKNVSMINNLSGVDEIFTASNYKSYKHRYFVGFITNKDLELTNYQKSEVSNVEWKTFEECMESIRPYNLEKKDILTKLNKVLEKYTLYL